MSNGLLSLKDSLDNREWTRRYMMRFYGEDNAGGRTMRELICRGKPVCGSKFVYGYYVAVRCGSGRESHRIYTGRAIAEGDPEYFEVDPNTVKRIRASFETGERTAVETVIGSDVIVSLEYLLTDACEVADTDTIRIVDSEGRCYGSGPWFADWILAYCDRRGLAAQTADDVIEFRLVD